MGRSVRSFHIPIAATAAIVYTACARADNQVSFHTDTAAANRSGLRAPLLMGVATLAMSVSRIIESEAAGDPERVARISCRFGAMVFMPNELTLQVRSRERHEDGDRVSFELLDRRRWPCDPRRRRRAAFVNYGRELYEDSHRRSRACLVPQCSSH